MTIRKASVADEYDEYSAFEHVKDDPKFKKWLDPSGSQVFVLSGNNEDDGATHCWMSPVALKLIGDKSTLDGTQGPTETCISHILSIGGEQNTFSLVIRSLVYQILLKNKHRLGREEVEALDREVEAYSGLAADSDAKMYQLEGVLTKVLVQSLALFDPKTIVWMILDRVDQCHTSRDSMTPG